MNHPLLVSHADLFMRRRRALSTKTLYNLLRKSYEEADSSWKLKEVKRQIRKYDEGSVGLGASVLRCLRGLSALTPEMEMELIQGFSVGLRRRGWGVVLHTALAETVRAQVLELSRKRFHAVRRRVGLKRDSTSPASGKYVELGVGVMAGGGRGSLEVAGKGTTVPFPRHARESDLLEGELGEMMSDVSEVLHEALPETMKAHAAPLGCPIAAVNAYQYPSLRVGVPPLSSHQVVIRGPCMTREEGCTEEEADHAAYMSVSDLHVDVMDGGGAAGSCTVHTCHASGEGGWKEPSPPSAGGARRQLRGRGLAVFPTKTGGRGVHIISMVPGWHCAIIMQTGSRLHGSVIVEEPDMVGFALSHLRLMRVVTYPLIQVENLLKRLAQDPEKLEEVRRASKEWVARRMHGERVVA